MKKKITIFLIIGIIILSIIAFWYWQKNIYHKGVLEQNITAPREVDLAEEIEYTVIYKNNGSIMLEDAKLIFEFPENSIVIPGYEETDSLRQVKELMDIAPGEERKVVFKAKLFGREGENKTAKAVISYRPRNLKARFETENTFTTTIKSIPITFEYDIPSKIDSGKEAVFRLNYFSNLDYPLTNLRVRVDYPTNFEFIESEPESLLGNNEWEIPVLNKTEGRRIIINGILDGEVGETKIFKATLGIVIDETFVILKEIARGVEINMPSIFITQRINDSPQYIANPGDYIHYEIFFKNTGEQIFENLFLIAKLGKEVFDFNTLQTDLGQIQTEAGSIIWDHTNVSQLRFLPGMEEGKVDFWIKLKNDLPRNPAIRVDVSIGLARTEFVNKINSNLSLNQKTYYHQPLSVFDNTGSLPPKVGYPTTYTISWQVKNSHNNIGNSKVKAILPDYVGLTGDLQPKDAKFTFDEMSREIVWDIGDLLAFESSEELLFKVAFTPTFQQKGESPDLISQVRIIGEDDWTDQTINFNTTGANINLMHDPRATDNQRTVE